MPNMAYLSRVLHLQNLSWIDALDIALVAILLYFAFDAVRGTRAAQMLLGIVLLFAAFELTGDRPRIGLLNVESS